MTYTSGQKLRASQMSGYVCTSGTRPTGHSGQIIYETDTAMIAMYDGSTWRYIGATGAINSDAEFNASATQAVANTTNTPVAFGTNNVTSPLVTKAVSGVGHSFTVLRAGRWAISTTTRWAAPGSAIGGERYASIRVNAADQASQGTVSPASNTPVTVGLSMTKRLAVNDVVTVNVFQGSGGSLNLEFNNGSGWGRINLSWIGA